MQLKIPEQLSRYRYVKIIIEAKYYPIKELYAFKGDVGELTNYYSGIVPCQPWDINIIAIVSTG